jgi:heat shock protein HtpX
MTFSVSLSRGIIDKLNDEELEAVIAHELTHIRNRDVRLLIISIVFVGIFAFISETLFRSMRFGRVGRDKKGGAGIISAILLALVGYLIATLFRFALSRKREYLADAGSAELTRRPLALASALRKIAEDPTIEAVKRKDVAQMFIENPQLKEGKASSFTGLFATHPPISKRIELLEQF